MRHTFYVSGMTCNGCKNHVTSLLSNITKTDAVRVSLEDETALIEHKKKINFKKLKSAFEKESQGAYRLFLSREDLENYKSGSKKTPQSETDTYFCPMRCEGDKTYDKPGDCPVCGMDLVPLQNDGKSESNQWLRRLWLSVVFSVVVFILAMGSMLFPSSFESFLPNFYNQLLQAVLSIPVLFFSGRFIFIRGWKSFKTLKLNMFSLISIGVAAAWIFSIVALFCPGLFPENFKTDSGEVHVYFETAVIIVALVILGQYLEHKAYGKTQASIRELLELQPATALLITNDGVKEVPAEQINLGDRLKLRSGDKVPVDATIIEGSGFLNESMITGESVSEEKKIGDEVYAGSILNDGSLILEALKVGKDTVLSKIIDLVSQAMSSKAPLQKFADKVAAYFVPSVIVISVITYFIWFYLGPEPGHIYGLINAVAVLIIACPCALGLATPISITVGIGKGAQNGILIKNAKAIDQLSKIQHLILDKTGTLTQGKPIVENITIYSKKYDQSKIYEILFSLAGKSSHPLSKSLQKHFEQEQFSEINLSHFKNISGKGLSATFEGKKILFGNRQLLEMHNIDVATNSSETEHTKSLLAIDNEHIADVTYIDQIKDNAKANIAYLQNQGIIVHLLTGDNEAVGKQVADALNIKNHKTQFLPEDKYNYIQSLQEENSIIAMAGDGINDAPALALANVGIAMGDGTDIAIESAEVILLKGDLTGIKKSILLSKKTQRNIKQNLFFALVYNSLGIPIAAGLLYPMFGVLLSPIIAAVAMSFSSVSVISNALRLKTIEL